MPGFVYEANGKIEVSRSLAYDIQHFTLKVK